MEKVCEKLPVPVATSSIKPVSSPSLQFGNISNFDESEHESDDGWSQKNEVKATPMRQCQMARDSWGDVWEDVAQVRCQMALHHILSTSIVNFPDILKNHFQLNIQPKNERPQRTHQQEHRPPKPTKPALPTGNEPSIFRQPKESVWDKKSEGAWSDVENE